MDQNQAVEKLIEQITSGTAPAQARSAAARGVLPLPRPVLARLFILLLDDENEQIRNDAGSSLGALDTHAVNEILSDPECAGEVLGYFADRGSKEEALAEKLAFHPNTPDSALVKMSKNGNCAVVDLVLTNQEKLLAVPILLECLMQNPVLRADQRGKILELLDHASRAATDTGGGQDGEAEETQMDVEEVARILEVDVGELYTTSEIMGGEEFEEAEEPEIRNAYQKILVLTTGQRAILAMKGGREERMILIRDTNKVVSLSVLKNPRLPEGEVENIAAMRNVSEDVLRGVGTNREWIKSYSVVHALVRNPRTPPGISTNFISRLQNRDLKMLARDRNVPEIIRRMSKRTLDTRLQKTTSFRKK